jgi:hypothetical protein
MSNSRSHRGRNARVGIAPSRLTRKLAETVQWPPSC